MFLSNGVIIGSIYERGVNKNIRDKKAFCVVCIKHTAGKIKLKTLVLFFLSYDDGCMIIPIKLLFEIKIKN